MEIKQNTSEMAGAHFLLIGSIKNDKSKSTDKESKKGNPIWTERNLLDARLRKNAVNKVASKLADAYSWNGKRKEKYVNSMQRIKELKSLRINRDNQK